VISVGGLALGGEGKTPVARVLAERLAGRGHRVGVVVGGYGGSLRDAAEQVPGSPWWEADRAAAARFGDEALLLASWLPDAIVVCGADKVRAAALAARRGCDVVVVDDGLQHLQLARDLDVLVGDGLAPPLALPAGDGRERGADVRVDVRWSHGRDGRLPVPWDVVSRNVAVDLVGLDGSRRASATALRGRRVFLVAAIARPRAFAALVTDLGATVVGCRMKRDHRPLHAADLIPAARSKADLVLCTEKDAARIAGGADGAARGLVALTCEARVVAGASVIDGALDRAVGSARSRQTARPGPAIGEGAC